MGAGPGLASAILCCLASWSGPAVTQDPQAAFGSVWGVLTGQSGCEVLLVLRARGPGHQTSHNACSILYSEELSGLKADIAHAKKHQAVSS